MSITFIDNNNLDLNDSELLKLERGPYAYALARQGESMEIDSFAKAIEEQCNLIGFTAEVKVFDTSEDGVYAFEIELNGRVLGSFFDPDRQVHEVTSNLLELPGETKGFIPSREGIQKLMDRKSPNGKKH